MWDASRGGVAKNLAIASGELGDVFLEFDTEDQHTYTIEATGPLHPDSAWTLLSSVAGHEGRIRCTTALRWDATLGGSAEDVARCIQETSDGGYIVAGYTDGFCAGVDDLYPAKTDRYGYATLAKITRKRNSPLLPEALRESSSAGQQSGEGGATCSSWRCHTSAASPSFPPTDQLSPEAKWEYASTN